MFQGDLLEVRKVTIGDILQVNCKAMLGSPHARDSVPDAIYTWDYPDVPEGSVCIVVGADPDYFKQRRRIWVVASIDGAPVLGWLYEDELDPIL